MSRKAATEDKPTGRGGKRKGAGRPSLGKVKMTVHVLPSTRDKLGENPGEAIDALVQKP